MLHEWLLPFSCSSLIFWVQARSWDWSLFVSFAPGHGNITSIVETAFTVRSASLLPQRTPESKVFENKGTKKKEKAWWAKGIMKKGRGQKLTFAPVFLFFFTFSLPPYVSPLVLFCWVTRDSLCPGLTWPQAVPLVTSLRVIQRTWQWRGQSAVSGHLVVNIRSRSSQHQWCCFWDPKATKSFFGLDISCQKAALVCRCFEMWSYLKLLY